MKFRNFTVLLLSGNNEAVNKKLAKCVYKPGGYMYKQVIVFAVMHCVCKMSICTQRYT